MGAARRDSLKRGLIYFLARAAAGFLFLLPVKTGVFLGGRLGAAAFFLLPRHRRQTLENLKAAFGAEKSEQQIYKTAKDVFINLGKNAAEFINFGKINGSNIDSFIRVEGIEKIDKALRDKKGVIVIACHLGNWELEAAYFGLKGYLCSIIVRPSRYERFDNLINSARRAKNLNIIPREHSFKKIISCLKANQLVGILPDQDIDSIDGVFVDFFGRKAYTPSGPVLLAIASGAPVFPTFCIRQNGRHKLLIEDPLDLEISGDRVKDVLVNTQKWSAIVERYIREYPGQWVWMHRRWKTKQKGPV
jgi:KDO2-lipid IV(A) lauroyltransferase